MNLFQASAIYNIETAIKMINRELREKMMRPSLVDSNGMKKGAWSEEEDNKLRAYIQRYGHWNWRQLPKYAGKNCLSSSFSRELI